MPPERPLLTELHVTLTLEAPVLSRASEPGEPGLDSPMARDAAGRPMLPYSLVLGKLREAWREIGPEIGVDDVRLKHLLGTESADGDWAPQRGRLFASDFVATTAEDRRVEASIRLDGERHAASEGALRHLELPFPPGAEVRFEGTFRFLNPDPAAAASLQEAIEAGLRWVAWLGAERTKGFGRLLRVEVEAHERALPEAEPRALVDGTRLPLALQFEEPFCFATKPEGGNLFESSLAVPGGALKGTVARMLRELLALPGAQELDDKLPGPFRALGAAFSALRFTHALPTLPGGERPCETPQSLVQVELEEGGKAWRDVALLAGPALVEGKAPSFPIDWKEDLGIPAALGWPEVERELRVRTAIDEKYRRAEDERLFAYEMVRPGTTVWRAEIDLADVPEASRPAVAGELAALLELGLVGLGKTGATAKVAFEPASTGEAPPTEIRELGLEPLVPIGEAGFGLEPVWVVTLRTPALLADPLALPEGANDADLDAAYAAAWAELSGQTARLLRLFTRERLAGGYLTARFLRAGAGRQETAYRPYLLTDAGSVFVLAAADGRDPLPFLERARRRGLELPDWAKTRYGSTWRSCPFTRQDGFGEIAVNLSCHLENRPSRVEALPWRSVAAS